MASDRVQKRELTNLHFSRDVAEFARIQGAVESCLNSGEFSYEQTAATLPALVRNAG
jgi:hypothetical protein